MFMQIETKLHQSSHYLLNQDARKVNNLFPTT